MNPDPYGVPTGFVPRIDTPPGPAPRPREFDAAISQALDEYDALRRDADCWRRHLAEQRAKVAK